MKTIKYLKNKDDPTTEYIVTNHDSGMITINGLEYYLKGDEYVDAVLTMLIRNGIHYSTNSTETNQLMKTVKYTHTGPNSKSSDIEVIQRTGCVVPYDDNEYPFDDEYDYLDNLINTLVDGENEISDIEVYYTEYGTNRKIPISKLKTINYIDDTNTKHTIIRRGGDMVTVDGKELPFAGDEYMNGIISKLIKDGTPYKITYTDYPMYLN